ncbi:MAG: 50S ribosomal protein L20 [Verrucomicrobia bacterium ADurb.Bin345]|nr:MAG: 50S ribosomal protein L20 [Verrucomicrobia bacterium ADurb.Bin345]
MPRITNAPASRRRRKRRLALASGFRGARSKLFRQATEAVDRAMVMHYKHRKHRKREFRALWITRLSAACKARGFSYNRLVEGLAKAQVLMNRKMLSEIAIHDPDGFTQIVELAKKSVA